MNKVVVIFLLVLCVVSVKCDGTNTTYYLYAFSSIQNYLIVDVEDCSVTPPYNLFLGSTINVNVKNSTSGWEGYLDYMLLTSNSSEEEQAANKTQKERFDQVSFNLNDENQTVCTFEVMMVKPVKPNVTVKYSEKKYFQFDCKEYLSQEDDKYVHVGWIDPASRLITTYNTTKLDVNITRGQNGTELFCLIIDNSTERVNTAMEKSTLVLYDVDTDGSLSVTTIIIIVGAGLLTLMIIGLINYYVYRLYRAKNKTQIPGFRHDNQFQDRFYLNLLFREQCEREQRELEAREHHYEEIDDHDYEEINYVEPEYEEINHIVEEQAVTTVKTSSSA